MRFCCCSPSARDIQIKEHYGFIEEYRPHYKPEFDLMHMTSHFFTCDVAPGEINRSVLSISDSAE